MDLVLLKIGRVLSAALPGEEGQDLVEYAIIVALISLGAVAGIGKVGGEVAAVFDRLAAILFVTLK